ncbi:MAG: hypothetical protein G01um101470_892 [Parcubacteria group bacterium Gr01-1014_70]|nr:MAG: hypothetical protein G01um101470_892 [Parcubacteria group bacterium Gr01-1014_70]
MKISILQMFLGWLLFLFSVTSIVRSLIDYAKMSEVVFFAHGNGRRFFSE